MKYYSVLLLTVILLGGCASGSPDDDLYDTDTPQLKIESKPPAPNLPHDPQTVRPSPYEDDTIVRLLRERETYLKNRLRAAESNYRLAIKSEEAYPLAQEWASEYNRLATALFETQNQIIQRIQWLERYDRGDAYQSPYTPPVPPALPPAPPGASG